MSAAEAASRGYRLYVLLLFTTIYAINFVDRQIVTILAPALKADLGLSDAQVGLLFGTAFALFYALFGLPLGRLVDGWNRVRVLAIGLAFWSAMTAASAGAGSFAQLALARMGIGVGEASASPAAMSVLQDYFPKGRRASALATYSSGIYLGAGLSLVIGGHILAWWAEAWPGGAPLGLAGWQATYLIVGAPGLLLAALVLATVREPVRGQIDGVPQPPAPHPFRTALATLAMLVAPFSLMRLHRAGARLGGNLAWLGGAVLAAASIVWLTDGLLPSAKRAPVFVFGPLVVTTNMIQWAALGFGAYATASYVAAARSGEPLVARLITGSPSFVALAVGGGMVSLTSYGISAFVYLHAVRYLGVRPEAGTWLGAIGAAAGVVGTILGGVLADRSRRRHAAGRVFVAAAALTLAALCFVCQFTARGWPLFLLFHGLATLFQTMWLGPVFATAQDHVPPRLRGTATAVQFLAINLIGLGLGPYLVGMLSDVTGELRTAILCVIPSEVIGIALFLFAAPRLAAAETRAGAAA